MDFLRDLNQYSRLLRRCTDRRSLPHAKMLHAHIIKTGFNAVMYIANRLVDMYCKCRCVVDARQVFDGMTTRNVFSWTALSTGYAKLGNLKGARQLFDEMPERDTAAWNAMIAGYARQDSNEEALEVFEQMQWEGVKADQYTFVSAVGVCAGLRALQQGKQIHAQIIRSESEYSNVFVENALVDLYAKCSILKVARQVFDKMSERDEVSWNAMIAGYVGNAEADEALRLFSHMECAGMKPSEFTFGSTLSACADLGDLIHGSQLHALVIRTGFESDVSVGNALIDAYAKCGCMEGAAQVFGQMPERDSVSWNTMIAGYGRHERGMDALELFWQMREAGIDSTQSTFGSVLGACASLSAFEYAKQVHVHVIRTGLDSNVLVGGALIGVYSKCGCIENACQVFDQMPKRDKVSWNAMISGYAQNGHGKDALCLFDKMLQTTVKPDHITFIGVLSACSHEGLVQEGLHFFHSMSRDHSVTPQGDHFACVIDLLGRAGLLDEAEDIIHSMPCEPTPAIWGALLSACKTHANVKLAKHTAERLFELQPRDAGPYVLLSNIYAAAGRWTDVSKVRMLMKNRAVKKRPGCSWIEIKNKVHIFRVEDRSHPQISEICATLERLNSQMKLAGYMPVT